MAPVKRISLAVILVVAVSTALVAQIRHPITGRVIASVMSVQGHTWLDRPEREREEAPDQAIAALQIKPGMVIADIGAGSGYYSVKLARAVGPSGRVFATDVQRGMLDLIDRRVQDERITNITTVLGQTDNPALPAQTIDLALMVDVYHELQTPQTFMRRLREALKPGGRLVLLEFRKEDPNVPIREEHKMTVDEARRELAADGYVFDTAIEDLPWQHIIVFKTPGSSAPEVDPASPWAKYIGTWRADPKTVAGLPKAPFLLRISVENQELVMEWHSMVGTETRRLPLDGSTVKLTDAGRSIDVSAALDGPSLIVHSSQPMSSGTASAATFTYTVTRNRLLIDHGDAPGTGEPAPRDDREVFTKVPPNILEHGGTGPLGPTSTKPRPPGV